ncbi:hypothetical protein JHK85_002175 [Glycine max]|nr:hypothetical protein JHK85_002175 [Glycine max]KAG5089509.1 hypothetical protein JHK86_002121 [Glycine max]
MTIPKTHRNCTLLQNEYSEEELLGFLQQDAILVWGLWTAKSSLLYPHDGVETLSILFSKSLQVHSSDVNVRELSVPKVISSCSLKLLLWQLKVGMPNQQSFPLMPALEIRLRLSIFSTKMIHSSCFCLPRPTSKRKREHCFHSMGDVVIDMLRGSGPNAKLKKAEILEGAKRKLSRCLLSYLEAPKSAGSPTMTKGYIWISYWDFLYSFNIVKELIIATRMGLKETAILPCRFPSTFS